MPWRSRAGRKAARTISWRGSAIARVAGVIVVIATHKAKRLNKARMQRADNTRNAVPQALALSSYALSRMIVALEKASRARGR